MNDNDESGRIIASEAAAMMQRVSKMVVYYEADREDEVADLVLECAERWSPYKVTAVLGITAARHTRMQLAAAAALTGKPAMAGFVIDHDENCPHGGEHNVFDPMRAALELMTATANADMEVAKALATILSERQEDEWLTACLALVHLTAEGMGTPTVVRRVPSIFGVN